MTKIKLLKGKGRQRIPFEVDADIILEGFAKSQIIKDYNDHPEDVRLALYVAWDIPIGLGSTFPSSKEFNKLYKNWTVNKTKYEEGLINEKNLSKKSG